MEKLKLYLSQSIFGVFLLIALTLLSVIFSNYQGSVHIRISRTSVDFVIDGSHQNSAKKDLPIEADERF